MSDRKTCRVISVVNQKGGVGKTTTTINLAAALVERGHTVLILDMDPQGNASTGLGIDTDRRDLTTYDLLIGDGLVEEMALPTTTAGLWIVPSTVDLTAADLDLMANDSRSTLLRSGLRASDLAPYDYVLIDCPPSMNILTVNALIASASVLVPLQAEFFALEGLSQLMRTVRMVRETANPDLRIEGVVLTMFDRRNNLALQVEQDARETLGALVFRTMIPRNVRISEAPSYAMSVLDYDRHSKGAIAYRTLAQEILQGQGK